MNQQKNNDWLINIFIYIKSNEFSNPTKKKKFYKFIPNYSSYATTVNISGILIDLSFNAFWNKINFTSKSKYFIKYKKVLILIFILIFPYHYINPNDLNVI